MKKIALVLAMLLVFGAGQAFASFDSEHLFMSVYNNTTATGDVEFGFDTGFSLNEEFWSQPTVYTVETGLNLGMFNSATWADLQVGMFGVDRLTPTSAYGRFYATTTVVNSTFNPNARSGFTTQHNGTRDLYNAADVDNNGTAFLANNKVDQGYDFRLNSNGSVPGYYINLNTVPANGEAQLDAFGDTDPSNDVVTMYLYAYQQVQLSDPNRGMLKNLLNPDLIYVAKITLDADGTLTISNVPVPGAIWLLGSGLLGLVGLRRKNA
jgi:hypothetical protein